MKNNNEIPALVKARKEFELSYALFAMAQEMFERGQASWNAINLDIKQPNKSILENHFGHISRAYLSSANAMDKFFALHKTFKYMPSNVVSKIADIIDEEWIKPASEN